MRAGLMYHESWPWELIRDGGRGLSFAGSTSKDVVPPLSILILALEVKCCVMRGRTSSNDHVRFRSVLDRLW